MFNLFIKSNTLFRAISGVFSASQPQPNGCVCDAANETTRLGFAEQRYWLHGIFWSIGSILPIKTQNSKLKTLRVRESLDYIHVVQQHTAIYMCIIYIYTYIHTYII